MLRKQKPVLGDFDPADYEQHREWAAADGRHPRADLHRLPRTAPRATASAPLVLYGYGSYEAQHRPVVLHRRACRCSTGASSSRSRTSAAAARWAAAGTRRASCWPRRTRSPTSSPAAEHLVKAGWTSADRLVARGGSAGGLLMGAVANLAPEAFAGIVAQVPFVDALNIDPRPVAAADRHRVGGVGQPARGPRGVRVHEVVHALRERRRPAVPGDPGGDQPQRHPRAVPRAGQVGGPAAPAVAATPTCC